MVKFSAGMLPLCLTNAMSHLMSKHIYLASPYTADDACVRELRYMQACHAAARLMREGHLVFSPIAHSHPLTDFEIPGDFSFWKDWCLSFLES